jgi:hypothetical protein
MSGRETIRDISQILALSEITYLDFRKHASKIRGIPETVHTLYVNKLFETSDILHLYRLRELDVIATGKIMIPPNIKANLSTIRCNSRLSLSGFNPDTLYYSVREEFSFNCTGTRCDRFVISGASHKIYFTWPKVSRRVDFVKDSRVIISEIDLPEIREIRITNSMIKINTPMPKVRKLVMNGGVIEGAENLKFLTSVTIRDPNSSMSVSLSGRGECSKYHISETKFSYDSDQSSET